MLSLQPRSRPLIFLITFVLTLLTACSSDDDGGTGPGPVPTHDEAITALENAIYEMMNGPDPREPGDIDFTHAHDLFSRIVADDPSNSSARLGMAVSGVMAVLANDRVNETFHAWEAYLQEFTPFEAESGLLRPLGIAISPMPDSGCLDLPFNALGNTVMAGMQPKLRAVDPTIGAVQDVLHDVVIPSLESAAAQLAIVGGDSNFLFVITPRMQGDIEADPLEFDRTDALALRAGVLLLSSVCRAAVTYDLSFATHDAIGLTAALDRETGNFLRLRSDGATQLARAETDFLDAVDAVDETIDSLLEETDSQDDDLIVVGPDSFSERELRDLQAIELVDAREFFTTGIVITEDWDGDWQTPPVALTVSAHEFFQNPVSDWKQVLPPYSVTAVIGEDYAGSVYAQLQTFVDVTMPTGGYASAWLQAQYDGVGITYLYSSGDATLESALVSELDAIVTQIKSWPEYQGGNTYIYAYVEGVFVQGLNSDVMVHVQLDTAQFDYYYVPKFTWQADSYSTWQNQWTNYTLNGLLPDMDSAAELMGTFGFGPESWRQEWVIEWFDIDFD
jgi:hypothetical protein